MNKKIRFIVMSGLIASIYVALTYLSAALGLAYGPIQVRLSEALCVMCAFTPTAVPALTVGCLLGNIGSSLGLIDMLVGTAATLIAALLGRYLRNIKVRGVPILLPLPFVVVNMVIIGAEIALLSGEASFAMFAFNALTVGIGQLVACYIIGIPLYIIINRSPLAKFLSYKD